MKKLYIYYSLTGNGDIVGAKLNDLGYEIRKIKVKKELPKIFFFRILVGGFRVLTGYKDKIIDFDYNIDDYNEIVIGSPIWCDRLCSPITTILSNLDLNDKKVSFILYSGSGEGKEAIEYITINYPESDVLVLQEPLKNNSELDKIEK